MKIGNILIFGDSITWGACDSEGGWADRLKKFVSFGNEVENSDIDVYNLGISGNTTDDLLERIDAEIASRLSVENTIVIFAIGTNDSAYIKIKDNPVVLKENFKNNLLTLIKKANKVSGKIIFVGLKKGSDDVTAPFPGSSTGKFFDKENTDIYNEIIKDVAGTNEALFINLGELNDNDFYDGLHPNSEGHRKIFETVKDYLIKNEII